MKSPNKKVNDPRVEVNPETYPSLSELLNKVPTIGRAEVLRHYGALGITFEKAIMAFDIASIVDAINKLTNELAKLTNQEVKASAKSQPEVEETLNSKIKLDASAEEKSEFQPVNIEDTKESKSHKNLTVNNFLNRSFVNNSQKEKPFASVIPKFQIDKTAYQLTSNPNQAALLYSNNNVQQKATVEPVMVVENGDQSIGKSVLYDQTSLQVEVSEATPEPVNNQTSTFDVETMADCEKHLQDEDIANNTNRASPVSLMHLVENISDSIYVASDITTKQPVLPIAASVALTNVESQPKQQESLVNQNTQQSLPSTPQQTQKLDTESIPSLQKPTNDVG